MNIIINNTVQRVELRSYINTELVHTSTDRVVEFTDPVIRTMVWGFDRCIDGQLRRVRRERMERRKRFEPVLDKEYDKRVLHAIRSVQLRHKKNLFATTVSSFRKRRLSIKRA